MSTDLKHPGPLTSPISDCIFYLKGQFLWDLKLVKSNSKASHKLPIREERNCPRRPKRDNQLANKYRSSAWILQRPSTAPLAIKTFAARKIVKTHSIRHQGSSAYHALRPILYTASLTPDHPLRGPHPMSAEDPAVELSSSSPFPLSSPAGSQPADRFRRTGPRSWVEAQPSSG